MLPTADSESFSRIAFNDIVAALPGNDPIIAASASTNVRNLAFEGGAWDEEDEQEYLSELYSDINSDRAGKASLKNIESSKLFKYSLEPCLSGYVEVQTLLDYTVPDGFVPMLFECKVVKENAEILPMAQAASGTAPSKHAIVDIDEETAKMALKGFLPFAEDQAKQNRYVDYLRFRAKKSDNCPVLNDREREEFILSAQVFKPAAPVISARFVSSSAAAQPSLSGLKSGLNYLKSMEKQPVAAENAKTQVSVSDHFYRDGDARITKPWNPAPLLCKRFNIDPPVNVASNSPYAQSRIASEAASFVQLVTASDSDSIGKGFEDSQSYLDIVEPTADIDLFAAIFSAPKVSSRKTAADFFDE